MSNYYRYYRYDTPKNPPRKLYPQPTQAQKDERVEKARILKKAQVFSHYGSKCACCGMTDVRFLTVDHIANGKGNPALREVGDIYTHLIKHNFPSNFQILCWNCNCAKGAYGRCPHDKTQRFLPLHVARKYVILKEPKNDKP
jgi:5-methylcytosine-specific restriction endonuclease McrA